MTYDIVPSISISKPKFHYVRLFSNRSYYTHYVTIMSDYVTIMSIMSITHSGQLCLIISLPGNEPLLQLCQYYYVNYVLWDLLLQLLKLCHNYVSYVY